MKVKRVFLISILFLGIIIAYFLLFFQKNNLIFNFDDNKAPINNIVFTAIEENQTKRINDKSEIKQIIKYLNSIEFKKTSTNSIAENDSYELMLGRGSNVRGTRIEFADKYISISDNSTTKYYEINNDIMTKVKRLFDECK
jgi:hypothetical protein